MNKQKKKKLIKIQDYIAIGNIPLLIKYLGDKADYALGVAQDIIYEGGDQRSEVVRDFTKRGIAFYSVMKDIKEIWDDSGWDNGD